MIASLLAACSGDARDVCERYVRCAYAVDPALGWEADSWYGGGGTCWSIGRGVEECRRGCIDGIFALRESSEDPACDVEGIDLGDSLTFERYVEAYGVRFCEEWETCNTSETPCPGAGPIDPEDCDYDREAAAECLDGPWTCNAFVPGLEVPRSPEVCDEVCGAIPPVAD